MELIMRASWADLKELARGMEVAYEELSPSGVRYAFEAWNFAYAGFRPRNRFELHMGRILNRAVRQNYFAKKIGIPRLLK